MSQKNPENLRDLLIVHAKYLYDIEQQLTKALPKMAEAATDEDLKKGFMDHLSETEQHVSRIEEIFKLLDVSPTAETSDTIRGMISDAEWCIDNVVKGPTLDASLISAGQFAEHYEMAVYGTAAEWAKILNLSDIKEILGQTLNEEKAADEKLSMLATSRINETAARGVSYEDAEEKQGFLGNLQTGNI